MHPERAIGFERHLLIADEQAGSGLGGAVDDQFGIGHQPERAVAHQTAARFIATAGPQACARGMSAGGSGLLVCERELMQNLRTDAPAAGAAGGGPLIQLLVGHTTAALGQGGCCGAGTLQ